MSKQIPSARMTLRKKLDGPEGGLQNRVSAHEEPATTLAASPDGKLLATGDESGLMGLRETTSLRPIVEKQLHRERIPALTFTRDSQFLLSAGLDGGIRVWNARNARNLSPVATLRLHTARVTTLDVSLDGKTLASGGLDGRVIRVLPVSVHEGFSGICYRERLLFLGGRRWRSRINTPCLQI